MNKIISKKLNKKGFTLTELIVVIVIIGILALVLIPTLTGYIKKAKESAAEQEAASYINAYNAWQIETGEDDLYLEGFLNYCVELELFDNLYEAKESVIAVDVKEKSFIVKASNDLYVKYLNGTLNVLDENPIAGLIENRVDFNNNVVKANLDNINKKFSSSQAELAINKVYADGSVELSVVITDKNADAMSVVSAVSEAFNVINEAGGKRVYITPVINGEEMSPETYKKALMKIMDNVNLPLEFEAENALAAMAMFAACTFKYEKDMTAEQWDSISTELMNSKLEAFIGVNDVKISIDILDDTGEEYQVSYYFTFVDGTN